MSLKTGNKKIIYNSKTFMTNSWIICDINRQTFLYFVSINSNVFHKVKQVTKPVFSREKFTTVTAYRGLVTKSQLLETLFIRNLLTKVGHIHGAIWGFLGKQVLQWGLQCCTETIGKL